MLVVRPHEHAGLIDFSEAIEALEEAFLALAENPGLTLPRQIVDRQVRLAVHQSSLPFLGAAGLMAHTRHFASRPGLYPAASLVFDLKSGALDAVVLGQVLSGPPIDGVVDIRTAATSAVATRLLARADASTVGVLGSGRQAQGHLVALAAVRPLRWVKVFSPSPAHRERFAKEMAEALKVQVTAVASAEEAVEGSDVVQVMTSADEPVLLGRWLRPGQHVTSVLGGETPRDPGGRPLKKPRRDLDDEVLKLIDVVVINSRAQAEQDFQGNLADAVEQGILSWERIVELKDLVAGRSPSRANARQITLYKNNGGVGIADMTLATLAARRARERGLGVEV